MTGELIIPCTYDGCPEVSADGTVAVFERADGACDVYSIAY